MHCYHVYRPELLQRLRDPLPSPIVLGPRPSASEKSLVKFTSYLTGQAYPLVPDDTKPPLADEALSSSWPPPTAEGHLQGPSTSVLPFLLYNPETFRTLQPHRSVSFDDISPLGLSIAGPSFGHSYYNSTSIQQHCPEQPIYHIQDVVPVLPTHSHQSLDLILQDIEDMSLLQDTEDSSLSSLESSAGPAPDHHQQ